MHKDELCILLSYQFIQSSNHHHLRLARGPEQMTGVIECGQGGQVSSIKILRALKAFRNKPKGWCGKLSESDRCSAMHAGQTDEFSSTARAVCNSHHD